MMFNILQAWSERNSYANWLKEERERRQPAADRGLSECCRCGWCCIRKTCVPTPEELPSIAKHLGLTIEDLVQNFMVGDEMRSHYFLRFANTVQVDILGEFLFWDRTYDKGQCIMFDEEKHGCKLGPLRPADAANFRCWEEDTYSEEEGLKSIMKWQVGDLEKLCPDMEIYD